MIPKKGGKDYPKPDAGIFIGTIIDVVELGMVPSRNPKFPDPKERVRIIWVLDKTDKNGKPYEIMEQPTAIWSTGGKYKPSRLFEIASGVFNGAPPVDFDTEMLVGRSNQLFLVKNGEWTNIAGFVPVPAGANPPQAPAGFVRSKDRQQAAGQSAQPNQAAQAQDQPVSEDRDF